MVDSKIPDADAPSECAGAATYCWEDALDEAMRKYHSQQPSKRRTRKEKNKMQAQLWKKYKQARQCLAEHGLRASPGSDSDGADPDY